jgi:hypothetical protein
MELQEIMLKGWKILTKNPIIFLPAFIIALLSTSWSIVPIPTSLNESIIWILLLIATLLVNLFLSSLIVRMVYDAIRKRLSLKNAVKFVASKYLTILAATILFSVIIGLGFLALIVPGIYLTVRLFFYDYSILIDAEDAFGSLKKSWKIVKGRWWDLFALLLIITIPISVIGFLFGFFSGVFLAYNPFILSVAISIFSFFVSLFYLPWFCSIFTFAYLEFRKR